MAFISAFPSGSGWRSLETMNLSHVRREYTRGGLRRKDLHKDPIIQFELWLQEAMAAGQPEVNAMSLATADSRGRPSSRTVLLRAVEARGFTFFTNYQSRKGREMLENPLVAVNFFWHLLERQVCICGRVEKLSPQESDAYFQGRPRGSQIAAHASDQSRAVSSRDELEKRFEAASREFADKTIPMPEDWGGFLLLPETIEFWQGRESRLHDRFLYTREGGLWKVERLCP